MLNLINKSINLTVDYILFIYLHRKFKLLNVMTIREFITFLGVTDLDVDINFDELGMSPIHPQDYCLKISSTTSGEVYWQFYRNGVPIKPNLIEVRYLKTFVGVANKKINHEND